MPSATTAACWAARASRAARSLSGAGVSSAGVSWVVMLFGVAGAVALPAVLPVVLSVAVPGAVGSVGSAGAAVLSESELPVELPGVASLPVLSAVPSALGVPSAAVLWPAASAAAACEDAGEDVDDAVCAMATRVGGMASEHTRDAQASPAITLARAPGRQVRESLFMVSTILLQGLHTG